jgi:hypothetical protein
MEKRLAHYYHCQVVPGWQEIVTEHLDAVISSGLNAQIEHLRLGLIGIRGDRQAAIKFFEERIKTIVVAQADEGWEQLTLQALARDQDYHYVLYAHTKGINSATHAWRQTMTGLVVSDWRECVELIRDHEAVGCYWITSNTDSGRLVPVFGGNFWWAQSSLIHRLPPLGMDNRHDAEGWIGTGSPVDIVNLIPGQPPSITDTPRDLYPA